MSTANSNRVTVAFEKLKKRLEEKQISLNEASLKIGHDRTWLAQRFRKNNCFTISGDDAMNLARLLNCRIQDFKADGDPSISPMIFYDKECFKKMIDNMPITKYPLVNLCLRYITEADNQDLKELEDFLSRPKQRMEPISTADSKHWFQEFFLEKFTSKLDRELSNRLIIPDEYILRDMVQRNREAAKQKSDYYYNTIIPRVKKSLQGQLGDIEDIIGDIIDTIKEDSAVFLVESFLNADNPHLTEIAALKDRLETHKDSVPRSNKA